MALKLITRLDRVLVEANVADVPDGPVPDRIIDAEREVSGFRYQIRLSAYAAEASRAKDPEQAIQSIAENETATALRDPVLLAEILRWSDSIRVSADTGTGAFYQFALLARRCLIEDIRRVMAADCGVPVPRGHSYAALSPEERVARRRTVARRVRASSGVDRP